MSHQRNPFAQRLARAGFEGPVTVDHQSRGLITDAAGRSLALALPNFDEPDDRDWFARELAGAINRRLGLPESPEADPLDPRHIAAVHETTRAFVRRVTPGPVSDAAE